MAPPTEAEHGARGQHGSPHHIHERRTYQFKPTVPINSYRPLPALPPLPPWYTRPPPERRA